MLQRGTARISLYITHSNTVQSRFIRSCSNTPSMSEMNKGLKKLKKVQKLREESLNQTLEEKRKYYKCRDRFITLDDIPTYKKKSESQDKKRPKTDSGAEKKISLNSMLEKMSVYQCDITRLEVDAIANAANNRLLGGGGVDGIIHRAAGHNLYEECLTLNGCNTGDAKLSAGYNLPAKYVLHTVGPIGEKPDKLRSCYLRCLDLCQENNIRSVAFPCISTGIYGYPTNNACKVSLYAVRDWLSEEGNFDSIDRIIFCVYLDDSLEAYQKFVPLVFNTSLEEKLSVPAEGSSVDPDPCEVKPDESVEHKEDVLSTSGNLKPWVSEVTEVESETQAGGSGESSLKLEAPSDEKNHPSARGKSDDVIEPMSQTVEEDGDSVVVDAEMQSQTQAYDAEMASQTQTDDQVESTDL